MGAYNVINRTSMQAGQPEDISVPLANFDAIASVLNGGIDNSNIAAGANITPSKIAAGLIGQMLGMDPAGAGVAWLKGLVRLYDVTLGAPAASMDTGAGGIPGGFKHLLMIAHLRPTGAANSIDFFLNVNNDGSASYGWTLIAATAGGAPGGGGTEVGTGWRISSTAGATTDPQMASVVVFIPNYASATARKSAIAFSAGYLGAAGTDFRVMGGRYFAAASAITRLAIVPGVNNIDTGSTWSVYGLG